MSTRPEGEGWWQASDGRWYPPELHPATTSYPPSFVPSRPRPSSGLTTTLAGFLIAAAVLYAIAAVMYFGWLRFLIENPDAELSVTEVPDAQLGAGFALIFAGLSGMVAVILFFIWFFQAYQAAMPGHDGRRWGPGWTIGGWFIPFANLVIPKLVMNEIDRMSAADPGADPAAWTDEPRTPISDLWWAAWVTSFLVWFGAWMLTWFWAGPAALRTVVTLQMSSFVLYAIAAGFAAPLVLKIGARLRQPRSLARG